MLSDRGCSTLGLMQGCLNVGCWRCKRWKGSTEDFVIVGLKSIKDAEQKTRVKDEG